LWKTKTLPELTFTSPLLVSKLPPGFAGVVAMPIDPFIEHGVFEPEAIVAMGEAFEAACKELHDALSWIIVTQMSPAASR